MITNYENFKQEINNSIQNSGLDIGAVYFILKDFMNILEKMYYAQLNKEAMMKASENHASTNSENVENETKTE